MHIEDKWLHEHWEMFATAGVVLLAITRYYIKNIFGKYATKDELRECNDRVQDRINQVEKSLSKEITEGVSEIKDLLIDHLEKKK